MHTNSHPLVDIDIIDLEQARDDAKEAVDEVERIRAQITQYETQLVLAINRAEIKIIEAQKIENEWLHHRKGPIECKI